MLRDRRVRRTGIRQPRLGRITFAHPERTDGPWHTHERSAARRTRRLGLRFVALGYLLALLGAPVAMIFYRTFEHGLAPVWNAVTQPNAMHAFWLSVELVAIVVPLNTVFGIGIALLIERGRFRGAGCSG